MRTLLWFSVGFSIGCALCAYCYGQWLPVLLLCALVAALLCFLLTLKSRYMRIPATIILGLACAVGWFLLYNGIYLKESAELNEKMVSLEVTVEDYSYATDYGCAFDGSVELGKTTVRVRVYLNEAADLAPGDRVTGNFLCRFTTDGGSDEPLYQRSQGIFLILYQKNEDVELTEATLSWYQYPVLWRQKIRELLDSAFPKDVSGFTKALLLGDRTDIDYETNTAFKESGISHIIAVSGLHVSILFSVIALLTGRRRVLTAILGIPAVILFAAVAGFTPSVTRAALMQILFMIAMLLDREYDPLTSLAFAVLVMLILNPLVITSVSFQLSVGCMLGIFLFSGPIKRWLLAEKRLGRWKGKWMQKLASAISISLSTMVFTTGLVALYFETVSLVSVITNLLTLWVVTVIFCGVLVVCLVSCVWISAAAWIAGIVAWPIRYVLLVSQILSDLPLAAVYTKSIYVVLWLIYGYILLGIFLCLKEKPAPLFGFLLLFGLCFSLLLSWVEPLQDSCRMTLLDVGQGQAILLQSEGKTFLVDCGGDDREAAADTVAETLLSQGVGRLDGVILTHLDADHAGGLPYLLTRIDVDVILVPYCDGWEDYRLLLPEDAAVESVREDSLISFGETNITVFAPISYHSGNESSLCVLFQKENCDILITGDRSLQGETVLLSNYVLPQLEVLVVGHHGSKTSTCEALLEQTQPEYAFISVAADNSYGHPAGEVLQRLKDFGCIVYRTDQNGNIIYRG